MVTFRPLSPLQFNFATSSNFSSQSTWRSVLVTDDIGGLVSSAVHESKVGGRGGPANGIWGIVRVGVLVNKVSTIAMVGVSLYNDFFANLESYY